MEKLLKVHVVKEENGSPFSLGYLAEWELPRVMKYYS